MIQRTRTTFADILLTDEPLHEKTRTRCSDHSVVQPQRMVKGLKTGFMK